MEIKDEKGRKERARKGREGREQERKDTREKKEMRAGEDKGWGAEGEGEKRGREMGGTRKIQREN